MHEEICTYEVAKLAKEKGFREKCIEHYYDDTKDLYRSSNPQCYNFGGNTSDAPTQSLLQRWLREEKRIEVNAFWDNADNMWLGYAQEMDAPDLVGSFPLNKPFDTYELALEDALAYSLENLV